MGLIPLEFYTNVPVHLSNKSGTQKFMIDYMGWKDHGPETSEELLQWNVSTLRSIGKLFNKEFTYHFLENYFCIRGRGKITKDVLYHFPQISPTTASLNLVVEEIPQLFYHVSGNKCCDWRMVVFNGDREYEIGGDNSEFTLTKYETKGGYHCFPKTVEMNRTLFERMYTPVS
jgi:hypothetical protein